MKIKKSQLILFIIGMFIGYCIGSNQSLIHYGDYATFVFEDNNKCTLSLDLKNNRYFYTYNGLESTSGQLKQCGEYVYKLDTGDLKNGYIVLTTTKDSPAVYIRLNDDSVIECQYVNNQLTLIGG